MTSPSTGTLVRPFGGPRVAAPTGSESAAYDRRAIDELGVPQPVLMENAGRSAAQVLERLFPRGRVVAVVGAGNNGGDALVLLRTLAAWGRPVTAVLAADREDGEGLLHGLELPIVPDAELGEGRGDGVLAGAEVVVDGILGTGISGAPRERQAAAIRAVNRAERPVLALDLPSGVDADTGAVPGDAVDAEVTVAFGWPKLGSLLQPGRGRAGRLVAVEIGFPPLPADRFPGTVVTPGWVREHLPRRGADTHKYEVGTLLLVAGRSGMAGAAIMAARAALRTGVGLLRLASPGANRSILQETVPEAIYVDAGDPDALDEALSDADAVATGPGIGRDADAAAVLERVAGSGDRPLLLDADALTLAGHGTISLEALGRNRAVLLTPHAGEMTRISEFDRDGIRQDRLEAARSTAGALGCTLLLKGLPSLVVEPGGRFLVDVVATSDLAAGGMGDVLTGTVGAFLAQGATPLEAAGLGLHVSGRAAARRNLGAGLTPGDVIEEIPHALAEEGWGVSDLSLPFVIFDQDAPR